MESARPRAAAQIWSQQGWSIDAGIPVARVFNICLGLFIYVLTLCFPCDACTPPRVFFFKNISVFISVPAPPSLPTVPLLLSLCSSSILSLGGRGSGTLGKGVICRLRLVSFLVCLLSFSFCPSAPLWVGGVPVSSFHFFFPESE